MVDRQRLIKRADAFCDVGRFSAAIRCYEQALIGDLDNVAIQCKRARALLLSGDFYLGWQAFEWRFRHKEANRPKFRSPIWDGRSAYDKTLLVLVEQGFGDTIQFARFVPAAAALVGKVLFAVQSKLLPLMRVFNVGNCRVVPLTHVPNQDDLAIPLMSLPRVLGIELNTLPSQVPYLHPDPIKTRGWRQRFGPSKNLKIGVVWSGNPLHSNDEQRSIPFPLFSQVFAAKAVDWFSLQLGSADQLSALETFERVTDLSPFIEDFGDTAAIIQNLDLVISADTSVAHLAGALAKPVWTCIPAKTDWRWLHGRTDSPWYPTMRLFRQRRGESWEPVLQEIMDALSARSADRGMRKFEANSESRQNPVP